LWYDPLKVDATNNELYVIIERGSFFMCLFFVKSDYPVQEMASVKLSNFSWLHFSSLWFLERKSPYSSLQSWFPKNH
jgi:hypothetical protein